MLLLCNIQGQLYEELDLMMCEGCFFSSMLSTKLPSQGAFLPCLKFLVLGKPFPKIIGNIGIFVFGLLFSFLLNVTLC